ncbi:MAG: hypothetical protein KHW65_02305 [Clostridiales bacterium]|nr:hypothetical protein [Clostridiales bacterium]
MSERESWEKELEALGRDSAAEGAQPVEIAAGETETGAEQSFAEEAEERARAAERDFERRLEKAIDRRIRNICLKTFAVAAAVCMVVFLIVSPAVGVFFPTPQHVGGMGSASLEEYLGAYYETTRPYVELVPANDQQRRAWTQNRGFGCYTVGLNVLDGKQYWARTGESNVQVTLDRGRFAVKNDPERVLVRGWNAFNYRDSVEGVRADLEGLPRTSYGYISVRANAPVSIETLRESGLDVNWIEVYSDVESVADQAFRWRGGLNTRTRTSENGDDWRQDMSSDELRQRYLNNLETLLSAPRLLRQLSFDVETDGVPDDLSLDGGVSSGGWYAFSGDAVKEAIRANCDAVAAQTGPLLTERYCVSGSRDALLAYLDTADIRCVGIDNVHIHYVENH